MRLWDRGAADIMGLWSCEVVVVVGLGAAELAGCKGMGRMFREVVRGSCAVLRILTDQSSPQTHQHFTVLALYDVRVRRLGDVTRRPIALSDSSATSHDELTLCGAGHEKAAVCVWAAVSRRLRGKLPRVYGCKRSVYGCKQECIRLQTEFIRLQAGVHANQNWSAYCGKLECIRL